MKTTLIITLTCPDRPGIVERITMYGAVIHSTDFSTMDVSHFPPVVVGVGTQRKTNRQALIAALQDGDGEGEQANETPSPV